MGNSQLKKANRTFASLSYGLRHQHFLEWIRGNADSPFLEILTDNIFDHLGGPALQYLERLREKHRFLLHGVGMNIGGRSPMDTAYLKKVRQLADCFNPDVISDHLCFTGSSTLQSYELLPLRRDEANLKNVVERVSQAQEVLGKILTLENPSSYVSYKSDEMSEGEFMSEVCHRAGCTMLLDINNLYVNSFNFNFDPELELIRYPLDQMVQMHIAGHEDRHTYLFDTHQLEVQDEVLRFGRTVLELVSPTVPLVYECDDDQTSLSQLLSQGMRIRQELGIVDA